MSEGTQIDKLKVSELKRLAADLGAEVSGKAKKGDLVAIVRDAVSGRLGMMKVKDLKTLARKLDINLGGLKKKVDIIESLTGDITVELARGLTGEGTAEADREASPDADLEDIGGELVEVEKDVERTVHALESIPAADMTDLYDIDQRLTDVIKQDIDMTTIATMLDMGRVKYLDGKYLESMTMLMESSKVCEDFYVSYKNLTHAFIILNAEKIMEECGDSESNDESAADALIHAKRAFQEFGEAREEAIDTLVRVANQVYREEIEYLEGRMGQLEPFINALKVQGVDVFNAERYLHRAREAFLMGELSTVATYLDRSMSTAEESKATWIQDNENDIPRVRSIIDQAADLGADVSSARKYLEQAVTAFENKDYSLCAELKKTAERKAMESQRAQIQKAAQLEREKLGDAEKIMAAITPLMREADTYGLDIRDITTMMNNARVALANNDYVNALTHAREAEGLSKQLWSQVRAQRDMIQSSGEPLRTCQTCHSNGIKVLPSGKAVCVNCGMVYDVQVRGPGRKKKKGWLPFK